MKEKIYKLFLVLVVSLSLLRILFQNEMRSYSEALHIDNIGKQFKSLMKKKNKKSPKK